MTEKTLFRASSLFRYSSFVFRHSSDAHSEPRDELLREPVDSQCDGKEHQAHHEEGAVMSAAAHDFAHLLRDDAGHRVDRLKHRTETLAEIRDGDAVPGAK